MDNAARKIATKPYIVCAFHTPDYAPIAAGLAESLDRFGLEYHVSEVKPAGTWEANTRLKANFIAECLSKFPDRDILYLDADARLRKPPVIFDTITTDIAIRLFRVNKRGRTWLRPSANTIYFRNTATTRKLVDDWARRSTAAEDYEVDEDTLCSAIDAAVDLTITALPVAYSKVFDADGAEPIIEQLQVSRTKSRLLRRKRRSTHLGLAAAVAAVMGLACLWFYRSL